MLSVHWIDEFVLSASPHLEGSYGFGEGVLPALARRGLGEHPAPLHSTTAAFLERGTGVPA